MFEKIQVDPMQLLQTHRNELVSRLREKVKSVIGSWRSTVTSAMKGKFESKFGGSWPVLFVACILSVE